MTVDIHHGDCRDVLLDMALSGKQVDSVVTDPPYGLLSIIKRFGKSGAAPAKFGSDGAFARASKGFMGKEWDGTGIERDPVFWGQVFDVMKPGGFCLAFSSARTGHRQAMAMEDAGFIMHPMIVWAYGQGMPKAHPADKALIRAGHEQAAEDWSGWGYGAQALKPALEPIYVAQKPFSEANGAKNLLAHGVGAMNLTGCKSESGRHPANLVLEGCPDVIDLFPNTKSGKPGIMRSGVNNGACYGKESRKPGTPMKGFGDEGSASRFFPIFYHAKASAEDRAGSKHPTVKPIGLVRWLIKLVTPPGGCVLDMFAGTGTTGIAAQLEGFNAILIEADEQYAAEIYDRFSGYELFA